MFSSKTENNRKNTDHSSKKGSDDGLTRLRPGIADRLAGEKDVFVSNLSPHLPIEMVGGSVPYIAGMENEAVWNAASQACATEKVHYVYSIDEGRVWYLACPSSSMSSNPDSWCPLAAALPGQSEHWDKETVYIYEQEGVASALRWDPESGRMQVFLGAARTILPRIQTMDANFVTINPEVATPIAWKNRALYSEKLSRATTRILLLSGLTVNFLAILILCFNYMAINMVTEDLSSVKAETQKATEQLMMSAAQSMQSDVSKHLVRIQELLDTLQRIDGTLVRYEVKKNKVEWEALIPPAYNHKNGPIRGKPKTELEPDGRVRIVGTR